MNAGYESKKEQNNQIIFYTKCCLLVTLIIYIMTKLFKNDNIMDSRKSHQNIKKTHTNSAANQFSLTRSISVQTEQPEQQKSEIQKPTISKTDSNEANFVQELKYCNVKRSIENCVEIFKQKQKLDDLMDEEALELVTGKHVPVYKLESYFVDPIRAVAIRRKLISARIKSSCLNDVPFENYDYRKVIGSCCENVIGYIPLPLGVAGPLLIDGHLYHIPMATTEGTLIASTNRGCTALSVSFKFFEISLKNITNIYKKTNILLKSGKGVTTKVLSDGMTRGPVLKFPSAIKAAEVQEWLEEEENFLHIKRAFDSTSRFAKLESAKCCVAGRYLFIRFSSKTGDAMGMNMLSKVCLYL